MHAMPQGKPAQGGPYALDTRTPGQCRAHIGVTAPAGGRRNDIEAAALGALGAVLELAGGSTEHMYVARHRDAAVRWEALWSQHITDTETETHSICTIAGRYPPQGTRARLEQAVRLASAYHHFDRQVRTAPPDDTIAVGTDSDDPQTHIIVVGAERWERVRGDAATDTPWCNAYLARHHDTLALAPWTNACGAGLQRIAGYRGLHARTLSIVHSRHCARNLAACLELLLTPAAAHPRH